MSEGASPDEGRSSDDRPEVHFPSQGETLAAWHLRAHGGALEGATGRPCVVMAHGIGGTRDSGLLPYAEAFAEAGLDALVFDYRCFGASSGEPRQLGSPRRHRRDYLAALAFARQLDGVDPDRVALWGTSWSGGHVVYAGAEDGRVAAVIAQNPDLDGIRALHMIVRYGGLRQLLRLTVHGIADLLRALAGREPHLIPIVGPPGTVGALTSPDSEAGYLAIAGPSWRNELTARAVLEEAPNRGLRRVGELPCPLLVQVAENDAVAAPSGARAAARSGARVELREYPIEHFDVYLGEPLERSIADQLEFLRHHLAPAAVVSG